MNIFKTKIFKVTCGVFVFFMLKYAIGLRYGYIDYFGAFEIEYESKENGSLVMSSDWYEFESSIMLVNFPYKPGCSRGGYFISTKGGVGYDYSIFAPDYMMLVNDGIYTITEDTVNNTLIRIIESENDLGIYMPQQSNKGMASQFLIHPSETGLEMKDGLIKMVSTMTFKGM